MFTVEQPKLYFSFYYDGANFAALSSELSGKLPTGYVLSEVSFSSTPYVVATRYNPSGATGGEYEFIQCWKKGTYISAVAYMTNTPYYGRQPVITEFVEFSEIPSHRTSYDELYNPVQP